MVGRVKLPFPFPPLSRQTSPSSTPTHWMRRLFGRQQKKPQHDTIEATICEVETETGVRVANKDVAPKTSWNGTCECYDVTFRTEKSMRYDDRNFMYNVSVTLAQMCKRSLDATDNGTAPHCTPGQAQAVPGSDFQVRVRPATLDMDQSTPQQSLFGETEAGRGWVAAESAVGTAATERAPGPAGRAGARGPAGIAPRSRGSRCRKGTPSSPTPPRRRRTCRR